MPHGKHQRERQAQGRLTSASTGPACSPWPGPPTDLRVHVHTCVGPGLYPCICSRAVPRPGRRWPSPIRPRCTCWPGGAGLRGPGANGHSAPTWSLPDTPACCLLPPTRTLAPLAGRPALQGQRTSARRQAAQNLFVCPRVHTCSRRPACPLGTPSTAGSQRGALRSSRDACRRWPGPGGRHPRAGMARPQHPGRGRLSGWVPGRPPPRWVTWEVT